MEFFEGGNSTGLFSWQHLVIVIPAFLLMCFLGVFLGLRTKKRGVTLHKNKVLIASAILIWVGELSKYIVCVCLKGWDSLLSELPLFLCSLQLFTLPLVCFTKGNFQKAMADMILIWGFIGSIMGTFLSTDFAFYNAFTFFPLVSAFTHCISGFASLYIAFGKLFTLNKKTFFINILIMIVFSGCAWLGATYLSQNYMFLRTPDGTPFEILYKWSNGHKIWYPISVIVLQLLFICLVYLIVFIVRKLINKKHKKKEGNLKKEVV